MKALTKNVFFSDDEKAFMVNEIARMGKYFVDNIEVVEKSGEENEYL